MDLEREQARHLRAIEHAERALERLERRREVAEVFGTDDPFEDGAVLMWDRTFSEDADTYTYVALRAGGRWYTTAKRTAARGLVPSSFDWPTLVEGYLMFADDGYVWVATEWTEFEDA